MRLNPADREEGLTLLGAENGRERARRKQGGGSQWVGIRADVGVVNTGRWAFCVWNDSGGNLRLGWSCADATLKLGTDQWSFGYGGTATKSHAGQFSKYGQTYGQNDAVTCMVDLDRRAIMFMKNGREIPGDAFTLGKELAGWPLFPHIYTKEATFSVSFDGRGGAPPLTGGFQWIANAGKALVPSPRKAPASMGTEPVVEEAQAGAGSTFVLTSYGWRTAKEAGVSEKSQEWRGAVDAYVKHFTFLLEREYEAEREAVAERVQRRTPAQLQKDGVGAVDLSAEFDRESGRITLWSNSGSMPYLAEISRGRTVLVSTMTGGVDVDDATKTISAEVENIQQSQMVLSTQYERIPGPPAGKAGWNNHGHVAYRIDLGPNIIAYKRIDRMLDELQRCLGTSQAKNARNQIEKLNSNQNLTGLLLPGAPLANALYADISESSAAASKWDPMQRPRPNAEADISRSAREPDIGAQPYMPRGRVPPLAACPMLNTFQRGATKLVLEQRRRFSLIQGPPGTGKTTTAVAIICGWLRTRRGPILATAFSNRGTDNITESLHGLGVRVLRMGLCERDKPFSFEARLAECGARRGEKGLGKVMQGIDVVTATCIGCGMGPLDKLTFPYVVVDEAAQVIEPAVLLPLGKGAVQAVMVGDQCQLPATVLSQEAQSRGLDISMFDRLLSMGMEVELLAEQYRMHPQISAFPSWRFYRGDLLDAVSDSERQRPPGLPLRSPLAFLHIDTMEQARGPSKCNPSEAACVAWLVEQVLRSMPARLTGEEIGVITPYSAQVTEVRRALPASVKSFVQVSSVDAFQGCEKDVIVVSLVRANNRGEVGFVSDWRRLNVALTRAKRLCVILGHLPTWLIAESALIRDWLAFHTAESADVHVFRGGSLTPLPRALAQQVATLRQEFAQHRPKAAALPRVSVASKEASSQGRAKFRMLEAARALAEAISSQDEAALQGAVAQATEAGVQRDAVEEGAQLLRRLAVARELAAAADGGDEAALQGALAASEEAGVEGGAMEKARAALRRLTAARQLADALRQGGDDEALLQALLAAARDAGVSGASIQAAEARLSKARAFSALGAAMASESEHALRQAVAAAKKAGAPADTVLAAEQRLRMLAAARELGAAARGNDAAALDAALGSARSSGVDPSEISAAEAALRRVIAAQNVAEALRAEDETGLQIALAAAREYGVEARFLQAGEAKLNRMTAAREQLIAALADDSEESLWSALAAAKKAGVPMDSITSAAEERLQTHAAARELEVAIRSEDHVALDAAIDAARTRGVDAVALEVAEAALHRLVGAQTLAEALETGDETAVQEALAAAREYGVPDDAVRSAEAKLRRSASARELTAASELIGALEAAGSVTEEDEAALRRAAQEARHAGVDTGAVTAAAAILARLDAARRPSSAGPPPRASGGGFDARLQAAVAPGMQPPSVAAEVNGAKRRRTEAAPLGGGVEAATEEEAALRQWSLRLVERAVLQCRKRKAIEAEDFDLAHEVKKCEVSAGSRLAAAKRRCLGGADGGASLAAELEELERRKRRAIEDEDFDLGVELKRRQEELEKRSGSQAWEELERVRASKQEAVEQENYGRASELKLREKDLEQQLRSEEGRGARAALALLAESSPEALLRACDPGVAASAADAGPELWDAVAAELRSAASAVDAVAP